MEDPINDKKFEEYLTKQEELIKNLKKSTNSQKNDESLKDESKYSNSPLLNFSNRAKEYNMEMVHDTATIKEKTYSK